MKKISDNESDYFGKVYEVVAQIPYGKVTTYGAISHYLGLRSGARMVGWALNSSKMDDIYGNLPCHRVVNRLGQLSGRRHFDGNVMEERLKQEGITFLDDNTVDLKKHFWDPVLDLK